MKRLVENMPRVSLAWWKQKNGVDYEVTVTAVHMACIADGPLRSRVQIRAWRLVGTRRSTEWIFTTSREAHCTRLARKVIFTRLFSLLLIPCKHTLAGRLSLSSFRGR